MCAARSRVKFAIIVPARLASTRFPRKLLHEVRGKPIILWTAERIAAEAPELPLCFAVDGPELRGVLEAAGYQAVLTDPDHACGTDRIAEVNRTFRAQYVINVQADEPLVSAKAIRMLADLVEGRAPMATIGTPLRSEEEYLNPNKVKLVRDATGHAICFSRAPIPYFRDRGGRFDAAAAAACPVLLHLGLYAYQADFLELFTRLPPGRLEAIERLEMLRAIEAGHRIAVGVVEGRFVGIDTVEQAGEFEAEIERRSPQAPPAGCQGAAPGEATKRRRDGA